MIHAGAPQQGANVPFFSRRQDLHIYVVEAVPRQCLSPLLHAEHPAHDRELAAFSELGRDGSMTARAIRTSA